MDQFSDKLFVNSKESPNVLERGFFLEEKYMESCFWMDGCTFGGGWTSLIFDSSRHIYKITFYPCKMHIHDLLEPGNIRPLKYNFYHWNFDNGACVLYTF